jgi:hypothetical protein
MTAFQGFLAKTVVAPASSRSFALAKRLDAEQPLYPLLYLFSTTKAAVV